MVLVGARGSALGELANFNCCRSIPVVRRSWLGLGLVDQSQKMTVATRAMAERKTVGHRS
jgi:hypothetical protein